MLAMLRVAPLLPSPTLRAAANGPQVGTGKQAQSIELESGVRRGAAWPPPVMHFYSGPPMHLLSGVDSTIEKIGLVAQRQGDLTSHRVFPIFRQFGVGDRCQCLAQSLAAPECGRSQEDRYALVHLSKGSALVPTCEPAHDVD